MVVTHAAPRVRSSHVSGASPLSTRTMVMHSSTGQTSEQRLQPTHSVSSTRGMRASGVGYGPCGDAAAARSLRVTGVTAIAARLRASIVGGSGMQLDVAIDRAGDAVEMNALVRAIPAGDVAKVAADALLLVDARDDLVIQVEMLPLRDAPTDSPRKSSMVLKPLERIQFSSPSAMSSTMR